MTEQNGITGSITVGEGASVPICGQSRPWSAAAVLCGFGPDHSGGHSWEAHQPAGGGDSGARAILEGYLQRIGLRRPSDIAQQVQITLLRQWTEHLDDVLDAEGLPAGLRERIIRAVVYGGAPSLAEGEIRQEMVTEMLDLAKHGLPRMP